MKIDIEKCVESLKEFNKLFKVDSAITEENTKLRYDLMNEEIQEYVDATDTIEKVDALGDRLYVLIGSAIYFKQENKLQEKFERAKKGVKYKEDYIDIELKRLFSNWQSTGTADLAQEIFDEVHRSNMTKICKTFTEAVETSRIYSRKKQIPNYIDDAGEKYVVRRDSDGKILKSVNWEVPKFSKILKLKTAIR